MDAIALVECAYRIDDPSPTAFGGTLVSAAVAHGGASHGAILVAYDAEDPRSLLDGHFDAGFDPRLRTAMMASFRGGSDAERRLSFERFRPVGALSELSGKPLREHPAYTAIAHATGFEDVAVVHASNPDRTGLFLAFPTTTVGVPASLRRAWLRLASHVAAGWRLRRRLAHAPHARDGDAILAGSGALLHADTPEAAAASDRLKTACRGIDRARKAPTA